MTLIKTSVLTAISTIVKMIVGFTINKIVAVYAGPTGIALVGQLQNFVTISTTLSNGAINNGVIKYTAEYDMVEKKKNLFSTALKISTISACIIAAFIAIFASFLSMKLFNTLEYINVLYVFSATIIFYSLNTLFLAILNGQKEISKYVVVNIFNSIFALLLVVILTTLLGLKGALYALVVNQSLVFFVTIFFLFRLKWFKFEYFTRSFDIKEAKKLSRFTLMAIASALSVLGSILFMRYYIGMQLSWEEAGYWQAIMYISDAYLLVITMTLSVYYLPRLSEITDSVEMKKEILSSYKVIIPIVVLLAFLIFALKSIIINILFTEDFYPMLALFKWQLFGDVIKITAWLLAFIMLAKAMTKHYIFTEIIFSISFVVLSVILIEMFGLIGVTYAFATNYFLYLLTMIYLFRNILNEY